MLSYTLYDMHTLQPDNTHFILERQFYRTSIFSNHHPSAHTHSYIIVFMQVLFHICIYYYYIIFFYYGKEHNTILLFVAFCVLAEMEVLNYVKNTKK